MSEVGQNESAAAARKKTVAKPPVAHESLPETLEWGEPPVRRRGSRAAVLLAIIAGLLALGLGYLASEQWRARQSALATLSQTRAELQTLGQEHARDAARLDEQQKLLAAQKQRMEQDAGESSELKARLGATEAQLNDLQTQREALTEHLTEFRGLTKQFQRMIDSGKLQINFRRGRMIVELPAAVLFDSGSAGLSAEGRQALQEIAKILRKVPGKRFMVGGHTDDVPIGKGSATYTSNWSLSAARAVTVTESLIEAGLRSNHLVAAGYGEFDPIASNASDKGRQKNRRIEIVLEPQLSALPGALADLKSAKPPAALAAP